MAAHGPGPGKWSAPNLEIGKPPLASSMAGAKISAVVSLPEPYRSSIAYQPAGEPGTT